MAAKHIFQLWCYLFNGEFQGKNTMMTIRKTKSLDGILGAAHLARVLAEYTPLVSIGKPSRSVAEEPWLQWRKLVGMLTRSTTCSVGILV